MEESLTKPVSSNGLSETPGLVWFGLAKPGSGSRRESGLVVCSRKLDGSAARRKKNNWIIHFCLKCSVNHN